MSNEGVSFDSSSFPALSSQSMTPNATPNRNIPGNIGAGAVGSNPLASSGVAFGTDFTSQKDDFPALSAAASTNGGVSSQPKISLKSANEIDANTMFGGLSLNPPSSQVGAESTDPVSKDVRYGLLGLLEVIRMADTDLNSLALGNDLTTFGLNLNSTDCLYPTFSSPVTETRPPAKPVEPSTTPAYSTPSCYLTQPPALKQEQFTKLQLETLFYMFYVLPRDLVQALAAQELCRREWKYHKELCVWIKARSAQEQAQSHPGVQFIYFDLSGWDIKPFNAAAIKSVSNGSVDPANLNMTTALLTEEDVRVTLGDKRGNGVTNLPLGSSSGTTLSASGSSSGVAAAGAVGSK